jgi:hypothetical protein
VADFTMKANDRLPSIAATLSYSDGASVDLTNCTVKFIMRIKTGAVAAKIDAEAVIVDAPTGKVRYDWALGDTDTVGEYNAEWEVTDAAGLPQTFPTATYHSISLVADLDEGI